MTEVDKLKKLLDTDAIKGVDDLEEKIGKEIYDACLKVLKENAVNDLAAVDLRQMVDGMALGLGAVMKQVLPQLPPVERAFLCVMLTQRLRAILSAVAFEKE